MDQLPLCFLYLTVKIDYNKTKEGGFMKKITILTLHLDYGGIPQYLSSLCKMLEEEYDIEIIVTYKMSSQPAFEFSDRIKITYLINERQNRQDFWDAVSRKNPFKILYQGIKGIKLLLQKRSRNKRAIKQIDSDYIITTFPFHSNLVGKYKSADTIGIATLHDYHNNDKKQIQTLVKSVRKMDHLVVVSKELEKFYKPLVKPTNCIYIPNVIDKLPTTVSQCDTNNLIAIGRLSKEKGYADLLDVVKLVKTRVKNVKLYLIGNGPEMSNLETKVEEEELENTVELLGYQPKEVCDAYLNNSSLYIMTSFTESFGLVLIEAQSHKIPCIAFDCASGARQILKKTGILISNRDKEQMADQIIKLLKNKPRLKKLGEDSYQACQMYLPDQVKEKWYKLLNHQSEKGTKHGQTKRKKSKVD